ncbi:MAG: phenylalanine--tRNA ligase subunit beta, partial [Alphaproteobacteria bacterium]
PMHAFDADRITGGIAVRAAEGGEAFDALDGRRLSLQCGDLIIADDEAVIALAGIMGSEASAVSEKTQNIMLESAYFCPDRVSFTRRHHAIVSEASMRFERGVDPAMVAFAMERATAMIVDLFGGQPGPVALHGAIPHPEHSVVASLQQLQKRLGMDIPVKADEVLRRMGFEVVREGDRLSVKCPSFRHDITLAEDLSEEYARIIGFDAIPSALPPLKMRRPIKRDRLLDHAVSEGFVQVISYAFISRREQALFVEENEEADIVLTNPLSEAMAVMRRSIWPGLLQVAQHNMNRQQHGVALVERGRVYHRTSDGHAECEQLAFLMAGTVQQDQWYAQARDADFFDLKGALERCLARLGHTARFVADD